MYNIRPSCCMQQYVRAFVLEVNRKCSWHLWCRKSAGENKYFISCEIRGGSVLIYQFSISQNTMLRHNHVFIGFFVCHTIFISWFHQCISGTALVSRRNTPFSPNHTCYRINISVFTLFQNEVLETHNILSQDEQSFALTTFHPWWALYLFQQRSMLRHSALPFPK